jgi:predicted nucleic acid-binding Zn ribbon protein
MGLIKFNRNLKWEGCEIPLYESRCEECKYLDTVICSISERNDARECSRCGGVSNRIFSPCADLKEFTSYSSKRGEVRTRGQEAKSDKRNNRANVRDMGWFKSFKKEYKHKESQPSGQRKFETLGAKVK